MSCGLMHRGFQYPAIRIIAARLSSIRHGVWAALLLTCTAIDRLQGGIVWVFHVHPTNRTTHALLGVYRFSHCQKAAQARGSARAGAFTEAASIRGAQRAALASASEGSRA
eukprot:1143607-Pleurochrysis_carterae.AAC.1